MNLYLSYHWWVRILAYATEDHGQEFCDKQVYRNDRLRTAIWFLFLKLKRKGF